MEVVKREIECAKETVELGEGLTEFVAAMKVALADGWQIGQDLPAVVSAAMAHLVPAIAGVEKIGDEVDDIEAFANGVYVGVSRIPFIFIKKEEK